jgi:spore coat polysaccharide biosynthesis predicted glycosyltransferase SpsG
MIHVYIFCEKSKKIGLGHYYRSLNLKNILKNNFITKHFTNLNENQIRKKIFNIKEKSIVIFDFKNYKKNFFFKNDKVFYITFDANKKFKNVKINFEPLNFNSKNYYSGPKCHIIPEVKKILPDKFNNINKNILIYQGGTDAHNTLNKICKVFIKDDFFNKNNFKFYVNTPKKNYLSKSTILSQKFFEISSRKKFFNQLSFFDFAVVSVGNIAIELGFLGIPCIYTSNEPNEIKRGRFLHRLKIGKFFESNRLINFNTELKKLLQNKKSLIKFKKKQFNFFKDKEINYITILKKVYYEKI